MAPCFGALDPNGGHANCGGFDNKVQCAPFVLRFYDFSDGAIFPTSLPQALDKLPVFAKWAKACRTNDSVMYKWDAELKRERAKESVARYKARAAAAAEATK